MVPATRHNCLTAGPLPPLVIIDMAVWASVVHCFAARAFSRGPLSEPLEVFCPSFPVLLPLFSQGGRGYQNSFIAWESTLNVRDGAESPESQDTGYKVISEAPTSVASTNTAAHHTRLAKHHMQDAALHAIRNMF